MSRLIRIFRLDHLILLATSRNGPLLFHLPGTLYLYTFVLSTSYRPSNAKYNCISSTLLSPSIVILHQHLRFVSRFWRSINLSIDVCKLECCPQWMADRCHTDSVNTPTSAGLGRRCSPRPCHAACLAALARS